MQIGELLGRGRTAEVFAYGKAKILKLFFQSHKPEWIKNEFNYILRLHALGLCVPKAHKLININGRYGIVFERIEGPSMLKWAIANPLKRITSAARLLAEKHAAMHEYEVAELPSQRESLKRQIGKADMPEHLREMALKVLYSLPTAQNLCHGDFHPDNVLMSKNGPVIIDWMTASQGYPLADVARTSLILSTPYLPPDTPLKPLVGLVRGIFHGAYLKHYVRITGVTHQAISEWKVPLAAARLAENVPGEREYLLTLINNSL